MSASKTIMKSAVGLACWSQCWMEKGLLYGE